MSPIKSELWGNRESEKAKTSQGTKPIVRNSQQRWLQVLVPTFMEKKLEKHFQTQFQGQHYLVSKPGKDTIKTKLQVNLCEDRGGDPKNI